MFTLKKYSNEASVRVGFAASTDSANAVTLAKRDSVSGKKADKYREGISLQDAFHAPYRQQNTLMTRWNAVVLFTPRGHGARSAGRPG